MHEFTYEGVIRHIASLTPTASLSMREAAGFSTKSSISHTFILDTRHDKILGTRVDKFSALASAPGTYLKLYQELAGVGPLGGDAKFWKGEVEAKAGFGIAEGAVSLEYSLLSFHGSTRCRHYPSQRVPVFFGVSQAPKEPSSLTASSSEDRRQCGVSWRMEWVLEKAVSHLFCFSTTGFTVDFAIADSIGGDAYWSLGASIISDVPKKPSWPVKLHAWVNAGRLEGINRCTSSLSPLLILALVNITHRPILFSRKTALPPKEALEQTKTSLLRYPSVAAGVGLIYRFDPIRVELNFGLPLVSSTGERGKRGIQVGMGLEFL